MPPDPPRIIFVSLFAWNLTLPEKIRLKMSKFGAEKFWIHSPHMDALSKKGLFTLFYGFNIFAFS